MLVVDLIFPYVVCLSLSLSFLTKDSLVQPERIDPARAKKDGYDVRSDVWSLGITLVSVFVSRWISVMDDV